jgi:hypothetical protein
MCNDRVSGGEFQCYRRVHNSTGNEGEIDDQRGVLAAIIHDRDVDLIPVHDIECGISRIN